MVTTTNQMNKKAAKFSLSGILKPALAIPDSLWKQYLLLSLGAGALTGLGAGAIASHVKSKNPKLITLDRKKEFYDRKIKEMENENWLNDLMAAKRKLETSRMSDEDRKSLEEQYKKLIDR